MVSCLGVVSAERLLGGCHESKAGCWCWVKLLCSLKRAGDARHGVSRGARLAVHYLDAHERSCQGSKLKLAGFA